MRNAVDPLLLDSSKKFLKLKKVYRYHLKKISDMTDEEIIRACHWYVWEHYLVDEFADFRAQNEDTDNTQKNQ